MIALAALMLSLTACGPWTFQRPNVAPAAALHRAPVPSQMHQLMKAGR
jgi:hypothetical protein